MSIWIIFTLVWLHFFADFVFQTRQVARNKSQCNKTLALHVLIYMTAFVPFGFVFALLNGIAHFVTDYVSSRLTTHYWETNNQRFSGTLLGWIKLYTSRRCLEFITGCMYNGMSY